MFRTTGRDGREKTRKFDLTDITMQTFPNLETLMVVGTGTDAQWDIFLFFGSHRARDNCLTTMRLLGFCLVDEHRQPVPARRLEASNSLPTMSMILE